MDWSSASYATVGAFLVAAASALAAALAQRYALRDKRLREMNDAAAEWVNHGRQPSDDEREKIRQFLARKSDPDDTEEWWVVGEAPQEGDRRDG
ncbi:hypothetical protein CTU88_20225 [Streptomyces sp. JV178]|uniref:hypothetical protein n=1 Tax=Streptomyces sp. JV178 TaxID=858632 RepID=UPI000C1B1D81|nr:hypothetical protein [Streptomyces sp. JV178]PIM70840.1 hypothetical protein CTU88_20225 [Streptomyces sp. JV178]